MGWVPVPRALTVTDFRCIVADVPQSAAYMRDYRSRNRTARELNLAANRARRSAYRRLAACHHDEFDRVLTEERAKEGLPAVGVLKKGPKRKDDAA